MDARTKLKSKLPSRHVTEGPERAPHRSYYYAMGLTTAQIHQPFVGVASCWNEAAPCNIALMRQAQAVKKGVAAAGGTPREFCTITVTDGIAMGHAGMRASLPSREVIADSVELTMRGHAYDALVGLADDAALLREAEAADAERQAVRARIELAAAISAWRQALGLLPQSPLAPDGVTVRELVTRGRYPHQSWLQQFSRDDQDHIEWALEVTDTADGPTWQIKE